LLTEKSEQQQLNEKPLELKKIRSETLGYELTYNPEIFKTDRATDTEQTDLTEVGLTTQDALQTGFGLILFSAYDEHQLTEISNDRTIQGNDQLEKAANWYQRQKLRDLTDTS